jgi:hypothetical protein
MSEYVVGGLDRPHYVHALHDLLDEAGVRGLGKAGEQFPELDMEELPDLGLDIIWHASEQTPNMRIGDCCEPLERGWHELIGLLDVELS